MSSIHSRFAFEDASQTGDRVALRLRLGPRASHCELTYRQLRDACASAAAWFDRLGCRRGQRIALLLPHSKQLIAAFFGAIYGGFVPSILAWPTAKIGPEKYRRNLADVVRSLGADWLATDSGMAHRLGDALETTQVIDPADMQTDIADRPPTTQTDGTAFIQFSGGTTGTQKSVPVSFDMLDRQLSSYSRVLGLNAEDRIISWLPLYHDMGLISCLVLPFVYRLPVSLFAPMEWVMDPRPFLSAIGEDRATLCWLPNFAFSFLASRGKTASDSYDLSSLRAVISCSEPVRAESMQAFLQCFEKHRLSPSALHTCYAMAEATFAVTQTTPADPPKRLAIAAGSIEKGRLDPDPSGTRLAISCGRPIPGVEIRIMSGSAANGDRRDAEANQIGEIWLRGSFIMDDYLQTESKPERRRMAFTADWYRTGDLGAIIDSHLFVTGRQKDIIIAGGVNVYPEDIEAIVSQVNGVHPGRAVALGILDEKMGTERVVIVAEAHGLDDLARSEEIEAAVRAAAVAVCGIAPSHVFVVPPKWIVKSTAGKISRAETKARVIAQWERLTASPVFEPAVGGNR